MRSTRPCSTTPSTNSPPETPSAGGMPPAPSISDRRIVNLLGRGEDDRCEPPPLVGPGHEVRSAESFEFVASTVVAGKFAFDQRGTSIEGANVEAMDGTAGVVHLKQLVD